MPVSVAKIVIATYPTAAQEIAFLLDRFQDCFLLRCVKGSGSRSILLTISSYSDYNFENSSLCFSSLTAGGINRDQFAKSEERSEIRKGLISSNFGTCAKKDQAICRSVSFNLKDFGILKKCGVNRLQL